MNLPPFLIGLTLLFWGWQAQHLGFGIVAAILMELPRVIRWRWDLSAKEFGRIWDLCTALFAIGLVLSFKRGYCENGLTFVLWFPMVFLPFALAHSYCLHNRTSWATFSLLMRRKSAGPQKEGLSFGYSYFAICLMGTSAANVRDPRFYVAICVLFAWLLWRVRNRAFSAPLWFVGVAMAIFAGYLGHIWLHGFQAIVENKGAEWLAELESGEVEGTQSRTAIGSTGEVKLSNRIVLRVEPGKGNDIPSLLRESSFTTFQSKARNSSWFSSGRKFEIVNPEEGLTSWRLSTSETTSSAWISMYLKHGSGVLPLPSITAAVSELPVLEVDRSRLGVVHVKGGPRMIRYSAQYNPDIQTDEAPGKEDLEVPAAEVAGLEEIVTLLKLRSLSRREAMDRLSMFFERRFTYSCYLKGADEDAWGRSTPITDFLLKSRTGHCEYFATASALLLRQAGIPSRYAKGYSVQEFSKLSNTFIVRARHAHAWTLVHVDGVWRDFDATPSSWAVIEANESSVFEPATDFFSWFGYVFSKWRLTETGGGGAWIKWTLFAALSALTARFFWKRRAQRTQPKMKTSDSNPRQGIDSEFYRIESRIAELGYPRPPAETFESWLRRVELARPPFQISELSALLSLHNQLRFDPQGLNVTDREKLRTASESWLSQNGA